MRTAALSVIGLAVLVALGVMYVPGWYDWSRLKPDIEQAAQEALGRDLTIAGDITVNLVPEITLKLADVTLANPPGMQSPFMAHVDEATARLQIVPLIWGRIVVEEFVLHAPTVHLEITKDDTANWDFASATEADDAAVEDDVDAWLTDVVIVDARIEGGTLDFLDSTLGHSVAARDMTLAAVLPGLRHGLDLRGSLQLNDRPVSLTSWISPLGAIVDGETGQADIHIDSELATVRFAGSFAAQDDFIANGVYDFDTPSVAAFDQWLSLPIEIGPEAPLDLHAEFSSRGTVFAEGYIRATSGDQEARFDGTYDATGDVPKVTAKLEGNLLDLDLLLPPQAVLARAVDDDEDDDDGGLLDIVPDTPLDLSALRSLNADLRITLGGLRYSGFEVGEIVFVTTLEGGVVDASLERLQLYGASIRGQIDVDGASDRVDAGGRLEISGLDVDDLMHALELRPVVNGTLNAQLGLATQGVTLREIVTNFVGVGSIDLLGIEGAGLQGGILTGASLSLKRPTVDSRPLVEGSATFNGESVSFVIETDPADRIIAGDRFNASVDLSSRLGTAHYDGALLIEPILSLDGNFNANIGSVGELLGWLDMPLPEGQPDPGRLEVQADFDSEGVTGKLNEATITGEGLNITATGSFDASGPSVVTVVDIKGGMLDLDRYLPAAKKVDATSSQATGKGLLAGISDEPIDLSDLRDETIDATIALDGIKVRGFEARPIALKAKLVDGHADIRLGKLGVQGGAFSGRARIDLTGADLAGDVSMRVDDIQTDSFADLFGGDTVTIEGPLTGTLVASAKGANLRALVQSATGVIAVTIARIDVAGLDIGSISTFDARIDMADPTQPAAVKIKAVIDKEGGGKSVPASLEGTIASIEQLAAGASVPLDLVLEVGTARLTAKGEIADIDDILRPDIAFELSGQRLRELEPLIGPELADLGPYSFAGNVTVEGTIYHITDLDMTLGGSDLAGDVSIDIGGERIAIDGKLTSKTIDLIELAGGEDEAPETDTSSSKWLIPDDDIGFENLDIVDIELDARIDHLDVTEYFQIDDLDARVIMNDGRLTASPFTLTANEGEVDIELDVNSRANPETVELIVKASEVPLGQMMGLYRNSKDEPSKAKINVDLKGAGRTPHSIASSSNGKVSFVGVGGEVSRDLVRYIAIGLDDILRPLAGKQKAVQGNCFVVSFDVADGVGTSNIALFDTDAFIIAGRGTVDLRDETIDMEFNTTSRKQSLLRLAIPFDVKGPLRSPKATPDTVGSAIQVAKVAGVIINPLIGLGVIAATETVSTLSTTSCADAIAAAQKNQAESADTGDEAGKDKTDSSGLLHELGKIF